MHKYIYTTCAVLIISLAIAFKLTYNSLQSTKEILAETKANYEICKNQTKELNEQITKYNKMDKEANQLIYELRKEIENGKNHEEKDSCDCYNTLIPDNVIQLLHNIDNPAKTTKSNP